MEAAGGGGAGAVGEQGGGEQGGGEQGGGEQGDGEDVVTLLQEELVKLGYLMTNAVEATQQLHAPEVAPHPPAGANPHEFMMEWARKRQEERPFATRGFQEDEASADQAARGARMAQRAHEMVAVAGTIDALLERAEVFDRPEAEQLAEIAALEKENEEAGVELEAAVAKANACLARVAGLQRQVAAGALGF